MRGTRALWPVGLALAAAAHAQITLGQVDAFTDGTTMFWTGGSNPVNIPNGGPQGSGDAFLQITGTGEFGPGGHLATYNSIRWGGNWTAAGVKVVQADLKNLGATTLQMRLVLFSINGTRWLSTTPVTLSPGSGWKRATWAMKESQFTRVLLSDSFATTMAGMDRFMFRHNTGLTSGGTPVNGSLGIDNVSALAYVPAPLLNYVIELGQHLGGDLESLRNSDDDSLLVLNDEFDPTGRVVVTASSGSFVTPVSIDVTCELGATRNDLSQQIALFNYTTNAFVPIDTRLSTIADTTIVRSVSASASQYVRTSDGQMQVRIRFVPTADIIAFDGWAERIDQVHLALNP